MKEKIYKKDHYENIKIFHDIEYPKGFSAYSSDLNRFFGDKSYPKFLKNLLEHKKLSTNHFRKLFEKEIKDKDLKQYEESFDINRFQKSLKKLKIKEMEYNKKMKNPYFERLNNSRNYLITEYFKKNTTSKTIKPYYSEVPEVGRYSPSYNFINKHIYEVSFSKTGLNELNKENKKKRHGNKLFNKLLDKIQKGTNTLKSIKNKRYIQTEPRIADKNFISLNETQKIESRKILSLDLGKIKNNHCLKFENYTSRKPLLTKKDYNTEYNTEFPNYYDEKYLKGNIDFNKLSSNKNIKSYFEEMANKEHYPPLGFYQPKYDSILSKTRDIYFSKKALPSSRHRQFKKIIYSYDVPYYYQIAPSLNDRAKSDNDNFYK